MSSSVCQGFQSCLEPRLESRFLRLKLAPPKPTFSGSIAPPSPPEPKPMPYIEEKNITITNCNTHNNNCKPIGNQNIDMGGWSFLQSLANADDSSNHDKVYVHPLVKRSASMLSEKSLKMCTESLGSETGSEVSDSCSSDDISKLSLETVVCSPSKPREGFVTGKKSRTRSFPPPLTSISGSNGVQVRSHREGGRLVLHAVTVPSCHSYFHAERSEGRLRLSLVKNATSILDGLNGEDEDWEEAVEEAGDGEVDYEENGAEEEMEEEESYWGCEDMEGNSGNVGGEIGTGKFPRPSCCKESGQGHKGLLHLEPFLVAT